MMPKCLRHFKRTLFFWPCGLSCSTMAIISILGYVIMHGQRTVPELIADSNKEIERELVHISWNQHGGGPSKAFYTAGFGPTRRCQDWTLRGERTEARAVSPQLVTGTAGDSYISSALDIWNEGVLRRSYLLQKRADDGTLVWERELLSQPQAIDTNGNIESIGPMHIGLAISASTDAIIVFQRGDATHPESAKLQSLSAVYTTTGKCAWQFPLWKLPIGVEMTVYPYGIVISYSADPLQSFDGSWPTLSLPKGAVMPSRVYVLGQTDFGAIVGTISVGIDKESIGPSDTCNALSIHSPMGPGWAPTWALGATTPRHHSVNTPLTDDGPSINPVNTSYLGWSRIISSNPTVWSDADMRRITLAVSDDENILIVAWPGIRSILHDDQDRRDESAELVRRKDFFKAIAAFNASTGEELWKFEASNNTAVPNLDGISSNVVVTMIGTVVFAAQHTVPAAFNSTTNETVPSSNATVFVALQASTGALVWATPSLPGVTYASEYRVAANPNLVLYCDTSFEITQRPALRPEPNANGWSWMGALIAETGFPVWQAKLQGNITEFCFGDLVTDDSIMYTVAAVSQPEKELGSQNHSISSTMRSPAAGQNSEALLSLDGRHQSRVLDQYPDVTGTGSDDVKSVSQIGDTWSKTAPSEPSPQGISRYVLQARAWKSGAMQWSKELIAATPENGTVTPSNQLPDIDFSLAVGPAGLLLLQYFLPDEVEGDSDLIVQAYKCSDDSLSIEQTGWFLLGVGLFSGVVAASCLGGVSSVLFGDVEPVVLPQLSVEASRAILVANRLKQQARALGQSTPDAGHGDLLAKQALQQHEAECERTMQEAESAVRKRVGCLRICWSRFGCWRVETSIVHTDHRKLHIENEADDVIWPVVLCCERQPLPKQASPSQGGLHSDDSSDDNDDDSVNDSVDDNAEGPADRSRRGACEGAWCSGLCCISRSGRRSMQRSMRHMLIFAEPPNGAEIVSDIIQRVGSKPAPSGQLSHFRGSTRSLDSSVGGGERYQGASSTSPTAMSTRTRGSSGTRRKRRRATGSSLQSRRLCYCTPWALTRFSHVLVIVAVLLWALSAFHAEMHDLFQLLDDPHIFYDRFLINRSSKPGTAACSDPSGPCFCSDPVYSSSGVNTGGLRTTPNMGSYYDDPSWGASDGKCAVDGKCSALLGCTALCPVVLAELGNCAASVYMYQCQCDPYACDRTHLKVNTTVLRDAGAKDWDPAMSTPLSLMGLPPGLRACTRHYTVLEGVIWTTVVCEVLLLLCIGYLQLRIRTNPIIKPPLPPKEWKRLIGYSKTHTGTNAGRSRLHSSSMTHSPGASGWDLSSGTPPGASNQPSLSGRVVHHPAQSGYSAATGAYSPPQWAPAAAQTADLTIDEDEEVLQLGHLVIEPNMSLSDDVFTSPVAADRTLYGSGTGSSLANGSGIDTPSTPAHSTPHTDHGTPVATPGPASPYISHPTANDPDDPATDLAPATPRAPVASTYPLRLSMSNLAPATAPSSQVGGYYGAQATPRPEYDSPPPSHQYRDSLMRAMTTSQGTGASGGADGMSGSGVATNMGVERYLRQKRVQERERYREQLGQAQEKLYRLQSIYRFCVITGLTLVLLAGFWCGALMRQSLYCTGQLEESILSQDFTLFRGAILQGLPGCTFGSAWIDEHVEDRVVVSAWLVLGAQAIGFGLIVFDCSMVYLWTGCRRQRRRAKHMVAMALTAFRSYVKLVVTKAVPSSGDPSETSTLLGGKTSTAPGPQTGGGGESLVDPRDSEADVHARVKWLLRVRRIKRNQAFWAGYWAILCCDNALGRCLCQCRRLLCCRCRRQEDLREYIDRESVCGNMEVGGWLETERSASQLQRAFIQLSDTNSPAQSRAASPDPLTVSDLVGPSPEADSPPRPAPSPFASTPYAQGGMDRSPRTSVSPLHHDSPQYGATVPQYTRSDTVSPTDTGTAREALRRPDGRPERDDGESHVSPPATTTEQRLRVVRRGVRQEQQQHHATPAQTTSYDSRRIKQDLFARLRSRSR